MGIASSAVSASEASKAAAEQRKKQGIIDKQAAENEAWFNRQYYQDITKRTEIQDMLRILDENQRKADSRAEAQAAIVGATPEQQLASREINRKAYADSLAKIASNASMLKDQYLRDYMGQRNQYYAQRLGMQDVLSGIHSNQANQWANAAGNAFLGGAQMFAGGENWKLGNGKNTTSSAAYSKPSRGQVIKEDYVAPVRPAGAIFTDPNSGNA